MIDFHIVIPARFGAQRLPGKMLLPLHGRPVLEHTYLRACQSQAKSVIIATDDPRIEAAAQSWGAKVMMTDPGHPTGTHRLIEVAQAHMTNPADIWVNVQGDEPLIAPENINQVAIALRTNPHVDFSTLCEPIHSLAEYMDPHVVKVVRNAQEEALYFSRAPIPFSRSNEPWQGSLRHVGLYAYRWPLLAQWQQWPIDALEEAEQLEQLRLLSQGQRCLVQLATVSSPKGVDTPADLNRLQALLEAITT